MVWTPAERSQSLPGRWRFRLRLWRDCFEAEVGDSMSQERAVPASAVPLEELSSWPEELCRRELPSVLPRLLISFADCPLLLARGRVAGPALFFLGLLATPTAGRVVVLRPKPSPFLIGEPGGRAKGWRASGSRGCRGPRPPGSGTAGSQRGFCPVIGTGCGVFFHRSVPYRFPVLVTCN